MNNTQQTLQNIFTILTAAAIIICIAAHTIFTHCGIAK